MGVISGRLPRLFSAHFPEAAGPPPTSYASNNPPAASDPDAPLAVVVGAGETGRHLATRLGRNWRVRLLDLSLTPDGTVANETESSSATVELVQGDGTSRLVLERAGTGEAAALVAATGDDQVNLECARLARDVFGVKRVLAVFHDPRFTAEIERCGAEPVDAASAVASLLLGHLDPTIRPAVGVGLGQGEIVEVTVLGSSPVIGRPLRLLGARDWLVAAIYRQDQLLVPHGDTLIESGDRVILVGAPSVLPEIAEYFRAGSFGFPMPFGRRLGVVVADDPPDGFWEEVDFLHRHTTAAGVDVFTTSDLIPIKGYSWHAVTDGNPLELALSYPGLGCLIVPSDASQRRFPVGRPSLLWTALERARRPLWIARGTFPYRTILLAAFDQTETKAASEVAVGLASRWKAALTGATATPPAFVVGPRVIAEQMDVLGETAVLAQVHRVQLSERHLSGNPIQQIIRCASDGMDLLVLGHQPLARWKFWAVDVSGEIAARGGCSTLVIPPLERR